MPTSEATSAFAALGVRSCPVMDRLPARHPWRQLSARQTLAAMHRELGLIRHAGNQRSRLLDERPDILGFERRVMSSHAGPDLGDPHRLGLLGCADDVVNAAGVALEQLGSLQQVVDEVIAPIGLNRELAEESIVHPGTVVATREVIWSVRHRIPQWKSPPPGGVRVATDVGLG